MSKLKMKSTLMAAAVALSCLMPAASAGPAKVPASFGLGQAIAEQGNAALRAIRAEMLATVRNGVSLPALPARPRKVSAPVAAPAGGGSIAATAACAE
jgi:hypothetical protein